MYLRQPEFTSSLCGTFTKAKEWIKTFKETRDSWYIYQNELDKAWSQHELAYRGFKDLPRRTISDKVLSTKAFGVTKNSK